MNYMFSKNKFFQTIGLLIMLIGCSPNNQNNPALTTVEYQLTSSDPNGTFAITNNNEDGNYVGGIYSTGWRKTIIPKLYPFTAMVMAQANPFTSSIVTLKILKNGAVIKDTSVNLSASNNYTARIQTIIQQ